MWTDHARDGVDFKYAVDVEEYEYINTVNLRQEIGIPVFICDVAIILLEEIQNWFLTIVINGWPEIHTIAIWVNRELSIYTKMKLC